MVLANCGVDGCAPLPVPLRWALGLVMAGFALVYLYARFVDWRRNRKH
jgi:hypothetical protein